MIRLYKAAEAHIQRGLWLPIPEVVNRTKLEFAFPFPNDSSCLRKKTTKTFLYGYGGYHS